MSFSKKLMSNDVRSGHNDMSFNALSNANAK